jgi:DNA-binding transcriptional regulator YdaS (Cro superfamily)
MLTVADIINDYMDGPTAAARQLGVQHPSVCRWMREGRVPVDRVPAIAQRTRLPKHVICPQRPDLFPPPSARRKKK